MNATRTRSKSSKKSTQKRGRSTSSATRGSKGGRASARKSSSGSSAKRGASKTASRGKSSARQSSSRASGTPIGQAIDLLKEDHQKVQKLFRQAERVKDDLQRLRPIVQQACAALKQHTKIEEQYFYPALQQSIKETDLIAEAYVEHASAKQLIQQLERGGGEEEQYAAMFTVLGEYVKHHIKEEEDELFPKARRARADFEPLLEALMMRQEGGEAEETGATRGSRTSREASEPGRRSTRGRQGRSRAQEADSESTREAMESDVEQPRRGRRGAAEEESGETETGGRGREQESGEQEHRSRETNR